MKRQLLLSPHYDINAAAAFWALSHSGFAPIWPQNGSLADQAVGPLSLQTDGRSPWRGSAALAPEGFSAVWYRWPRYAEDFPNVAASDREFVSREWRQFQLGIEALNGELDSALWVNTPTAALRTESKLVQLQEASRCGLRFPSTLVSTDPDAIRKFVAERGRVIFKPFRTHSWREIETGRTFNTPATLIDADALPDDATLALCPGIYQEFVDKAWDLRVTVIGERIFPVRIGSRSCGAFVDWRPAVHQEADLLTETCSLPDATLRRVRALMNRLGIIYGAVDLVADQHGEVYFLEVNQVGQYLFVEDWLPELPLLQSMCAMLAEGRTDYSLATCPEISFTNFRASDYYSQWLADNADCFRRNIEGAKGCSLEEVACPSAA